MFTPDFFPNAPFAWAFCLLVVAFTAAAAVIDTRTAKIPNRLTVLILFAGVLATLVRSVWQAAVDHPLFAFDTGTAWVGGPDGMLFALTGFLVGFGLFFAFWTFGLAGGGGDVKLMAALGAWFGPKGFLALWVVSIFMLLLWSGFVIVYAKATGKKNIGPTAPAPTPKFGAKPPRKKRGLQVTYSVPVALATVLACVWMFRFDLQLMPKPATATGGPTDAPTAPQ